MHFQGVAMETKGSSSPAITAEEQESLAMVDKLLHKAQKARDVQKKVCAGQQIRSKIDSFQNTKFLISQPNPMILPLIGIVSERRFQ